MGIGDGFFKNLFGGQSEEAAFEKSTGFKPEILIVGADDGELLRAEITRSDGAVEKILLLPDKSGVFKGATTTDNTRFTVTLSPVPAQTPGQPPTWKVEYTSTGTPGSPLADQKITYAKEHKLSSIVAQDAEIKGYKGEINSKYLTDFLVEPDPVTPKAKAPVTKPSRAAPAPPPVVATPAPAAPTVTPKPAPAPAAITPPVATPVVPVIPAAPPAPIGPPPKLEIARARMIVNALRNEMLLQGNDPSVLRDAVNGLEKLNNWATSGKPPEPLTPKEAKAVLAVTERYAPNSAGPIGAIGNYINKPAENTNLYEEFSLPEEEIPKTRMDAIKAAGAKGPTGSPPPVHLATGVTPDMMRAALNMDKPGTPVKSDAEVVKAYNDAYEKAAGKATPDVQESLKKAGPTTRAVFMMRTTAANGGPVPFLSADPIGDQATLEAKTAKIRSASAPAPTTVAPPATPTVSPNPAVTPKPAVAPLAPAPAVPKPAVTPVTPPVTPKPAVTPPVPPVVPNPRPALPTPKVSPEQQLQEFQQQKEALQRLAQNNAEALEKLGASKDQVAKLAKATPGALNGEVIATLTEVAANGNQATLNTMIEQNVAAHKPGGTGNSPPPPAPKPSGPPAPPTPPAPKPPDPISPLKGGAPEPVKAGTGRLQLLHAIANANPGMLKELGVSPDTIKEFAALTDAESIKAKATGVIYEVDKAGKVAELGKLIDLAASDFTKISGAPGAGAPSAGGKPGDGPKPGGRPPSAPGTPGKFENGRRPPNTRNYTRETPHTVIDGVPYDANGREVKFRSGSTAGPSPAKTATPYPDISAGPNGDPTLVPPPTPPAPSPSAPVVVTASGVTLTPEQQALVNGSRELGKLASTYENQQKLLKMGFTAEDLTVLGKEAKTVSEAQAKQAYLERLSQSGKIDLTSAGKAIESQKSQGVGAQAKAGTVLGIAQLVHAKTPEERAVGATFLTLGTAGIVGNLAPFVESGTLLGKAGSVMRFASHTLSPVLAGTGTNEMINAKDVGEFVHGGSVAAVGYLCATKVGLEVAERAGVKAAGKILASKVATAPLRAVPLLGWGLLASDGIGLAADVTGNLGYNQWLLQPHQDAIVQGLTLDQSSRMPARVPGTFGQALASLPAGYSDLDVPTPTVDGFKNIKRVQELVEVYRKKGHKVGEALPNAGTPGQVANATDDVRNSAKAEREKIKEKLKKEFYIPAFGSWDDLDTPLGRGKLERQYATKTTYTPGVDRQKQINDFTALLRAMDECEHHIEVANSASHENGVTQLPLMKDAKKRAEAAGEKFHDPFFDPMQHGPNAGAYRPKTASYTDCYDEAKRLHAAYAATLKQRPPTRETAATTTNAEQADADLKLLTPLVGAKETAFRTSFEAVHKPQVENIARMQAELFTMQCKVTGVKQTGLMTPAEIDEWLKTSSPAKQDSPDYKAMQKKQEELNTAIIAFAKQSGYAPNANPDLAESTKVVQQFTTYHERLAALKLREAQNKEAEGKFDPYHLEEARAYDLKRKQAALLHAVPAAPTGKQAEVYEVKNKDPADFVLAGHLAVRGDVVTTTAQLGIKADKVLSEEAKKDIERWNALMVEYGPVAGTGSAVEAALFAELQAIDSRTKAHMEQANANFLTLVGQADQQNAQLMAAFEANPNRELSEQARTNFVALQWTEDELALLMSVQARTEALEAKYGPGKVPMSELKLTEEEVKAVYRQPGQEFGKKFNGERATCYIYQDGKLYFDDYEFSNDPRKGNRKVEEVDGKLYIPEVTTIKPAAFIAERIAGLKLDQSVQKRNLAHAALSQDELAAVVGKEEAARIVAARPPGSKVNAPGAAPTADQKEVTAALANWGASVDKILGPKAMVLADAAVETGALVQARLNIQQLGLQPSDIPKTGILARATEPYSRPFEKLIQQFDSFTPEQRDKMLDACIELNRSCAKKGIAPVFGGNTHQEVAFLEKLNSEQRLKLLAANAEINATFKGKYPLLDATELQDRINRGALPGQGAGASIGFFDYQKQVDELMKLDPEKRSEALRLNAEENQKYAKLKLGDPPKVDAENLLQLANTRGVKIPDGFFAGKQGALDQQVASYYEYIRANALTDENRAKKSLTVPTGNFVEQDKPEVKAQIDAIRNARDAKKAEIAEREKAERLDVDKLTPEQQKARLAKNDEDVRAAGRKAGTLPVTEEAKQALQHIYAKLSAEMGKKVGAGSIEQKHLDDLHYFASEYLGIDLAKPGDPRHLGTRLGAAPEVSINGLPPHIAGLADAIAAAVGSARYAMRDMDSKAPPEEGPGSIPGKVAAIKPPGKGSTYTGI